MEEAVREMRNRYCREWRKAHKDKVRQYHENYWKHKVERMIEEQAKEEAEKHFDAITAETYDPENRIYNLTLYLAAIEREHPALWAELMEKFDGMPGYAGVEEL